MLWTSTTLYWFKQLKNNLKKETRRNSIASLFASITFNEDQILTESDLFEIYKEFKVDWDITCKFTVKFSKEEIEADKESTTSLETILKKKF